MELGAVGGRRSGDSELSSQTTEYLIFLRVGAGWALILLNFQMG